jgi:hypothetical protein
MCFMTVSYPDGRVGLASGSARSLRQGVGPRLNASRSPRMTPQGQHLVHESEVVTVGHSGAMTDAEAGHIIRLVAAPRTFAGPERPSCALQAGHDWQTTLVGW